MAITRAFAWCMVGLSGSGVAVDAMAVGGTLDPAFGRAGVAILNATEFPDAVERSGRLRVDALGRSVFAVQSGRQILVERRLPNGVIDAGFGVAGRAYVDVGGIEQEVIDLEIVTTGPLAGGLAILSASPVGQRCTITRIDSTGDRVASFGNDGFRSVFDPAIDANAQCNDLALDGAAPIVAANLNTTSLPTQGALFAFDADGAPREGFGTAGRLVLDLAGSNTLFDRAESVEATDLGLVVAGRALRQFRRSLFVARLDRTTGAFDPGFSGDGVWLEETFADTVGALAGKVEADGILLLGLSTNGAVLYFWKVGADGASSPSFGTDGRCFAVLPGTPVFSTAQRYAEVLTDGPNALALFPASGTIFAASVNRATCAAAGAFAAPRAAITEPPTASAERRFAGAALQGARLLIGGVIETPLNDAELHALDRSTGTIVDLAPGERTASINGPIPSFDAPQAAQRSGAGTTIAGVTFFGAWTTLYALRLDEFGHRDSTFGNGGVSLIPVQQAYPLPYAAALVRDDGILLAGTRAYANAGPRPLGFDEPYGPHVHRLSPDGAIDGTFGGAGVAALATGSAAARIVALGSDGDAVLALSRDDVGAVRASILHRLLPTGLVDPGFAAGGPLRFAVGGQDPNDRFDAVVATGNGIYVAGANPGTSGRVVVRAFTRTGKPLPGFGTHGRVSVAIAGVSSAARVAASTWDDELIVAALAYTGDLAELAVFRLDASGALDTAFGDNGVARVPLGRLQADLAATTLHRDGDALLAATTRWAGPSLSLSRARMAVVRFDAQGRRDPGFGTDGIADVELPNDASSSAAGLAIFPQHYVLAGSSVQRTAAAKLSKGQLDRVFANGFE